jgi:hypothetical protein
MTPQFAQGFEMRFHSTGVATHHRTGDRLAGAIPEDIFDCN